MILRFAILLCLISRLHLLGQSYYLFVGTYTDTGSKGVYVYKFNTQNGTLDSVSHTLDSIVNPSYLAVADNGKFVYACTDTKRPNSGSISSFSFDQQKGVLNFINKQPSHGDNPVYVAVHRSNKWLVIGNYSGGSISCYPIEENGTILPVTRVVKHKGSSVHPDRQKSPHVHCTIFSPSQKEVLATDLGMDKVLIYSFNSSTSKTLGEIPISSQSSTPGSGPRQCIFCVHDTSVLFNTNRIKTMPLFQE